jgi:hypothetical protein
MKQNYKDHNTLTTRDLIEALGWHSHLARVDNELAEYWRLRFDLLSRAMGLPTAWNENRVRTSHMLRPLAVGVINGGFFSGFLEWSPLPDEIEIHKVHGPRIKVAEAEVRARLLEYADELLLAFWPELRGKSVRIEDLVAAGLPCDQPDPIDFM